MKTNGFLKLNDFSDICGRFDQNKLFVVDLVFKIPDTNKQCKEEMFLKICIKHISGWFCVFFVKEYFFLYLNIDCKNVNFVHKNGLERFERRFCILFSKNIFVAHKGNVTRNLTTKQVFF